MATNPMQRKARNSFLLGMFITLLIAGVIIAFLFIQLKNKTDKEKLEKQASVQAYALNQDVSSGQVITTDMLTKQTVNRNLVPSNATSDITMIENYALRDKEGRDIYTKYYDEKHFYLYLNDNNDKIPVKKEEATGNYYIEYIKNNDNNYNICTKTEKVNDKEYEYIYLKVGDNEYPLKDDSKNNVYIGCNDIDQEGLYVQTKNGNTVKQKEVNPDEVSFASADNYIKYNPEKKYIELDNIPLVAKVTMKRNTLITKELLSKADNIVQDDVRKQEYNMLVLPTDLTTGDYIDVRVMFPNGQDYIVVSKKEVEIPTISGVESLDTIWVNLSEDEILHMSCAIIDSAQVKGTKLYATKYTEAGMQNAAIPTYPINESTSMLLQSDPNVLKKAMNELKTRYGNGNSAELRKEYINKAIESEGQQALSNIESSMRESITNSKNSRKQYLDSLSGSNN